jgi:glyoxylase-like metal-dependent hydrolase (beta-lactamase superfamily II)
LEVVPAIHKIDGTWGGNVYLLVDDDGLALVDAALPLNSRRILRYIMRLGRDLSELRLKL